MLPSPDRRTALSFIVTLTVLALFVFAAPAQAIVLDLSVPTEATVGSTTTLELYADIADGESVPISEVSLSLDGPAGVQTCTFAVDGTPISGCAGLTISLTESSDLNQSNRTATGFDGSTDVTTDFGYGYGFGSIADDTREFTWSVQWDTTGYAEGDYTIDYTIIAEDGSVMATYTTTYSLTTSLSPVESASISIADFYPQENDYVFICNAAGFTATSYSWDFGDGNVQEGMTANDVFHTFDTNGNFTVTCTATDGTDTATATLDVTVTEAPTGGDGGGSSPNVTVTIAPSFPQGGDYVFECNVEGFTATSYDWTFGDGDSQMDSTNQNVFHTYTADGTYTVVCTAEDGSNSLSGSLDVTVSGLGGDGGDGGDGGVGGSGGTSLELKVAPFFPQGLDYVFVCDANGFTATDVDWNFGDGNTQSDMTREDVFHRFAFGGNYTVSCTASDGTTTLTDTLSISAAGSGGGGGGGSSAPSATLSIKSGFPQDNSYVFVCDESGFIATSYDWFFGDGEKLLDINRDNVYHTYAADGDYTVTCIASSATKEATATLDVTVGEGGTPPGEEPPTGDACFDNVFDIPATCAGGVITSDSSVFGCRLITCATTASSTTVLACNKPGDHDTDGFEMYLQSQTGAPLEVCLGDACISDNGFDSGDLPMCTDDDGEEEPSLDVEVSVKEWFPQGTHYVFLCDAEGFTATSYSWDFGDGTSTTLSQNDVYHVFEAGGSYDVTCAATDGTNTVSGDISVTVA